MRVAETTGVSRGRRRLTRQKVLEAGLVIADAEGIEALTMRRLAESLGVEAMSLYRHVANKEDLIHGLLDLVDAEIAVPPDADDWKLAVRQFAISAHDAMLRHRWSCPLMLSANPSRIRLARIRYMEGLLRVLHRGGMAPDLTHHAYHAIESHIMGFTLWQVNMRLPAKDFPRLTKSLFSQIDEEEFPYTVEHGRQHLAPDAPTGNQEFEFGLDLILDGLVHIRDSAQSGNSTR